MAKTVADLIRQSRENASKRVWLFNPDTKDFKVKFGPRTYILPAQETKQFSYPVALHVKKHLVIHLLNKRGGNGVVTPQKLKKVQKEVEVKVD